MSRFLRFLCLFAASCLLPSSAFAFTMSPTMMDLFVDPGGAQSAYVTVGNDQNTPVTYYISLQKFIPSGDQGQQQFLGPEEREGLPSWFKLDRASVTLRPGETRRVPFEIAVPMGTQPGGYYGVLFFSNVPPGSLSEKDIMAGSRTGMLLFVTVKGVIVEKSHIVESTIDPTWTNHLPIQFSTLLQNDGTAYLIPQGSVSIKNMFGKTAAVLPFNPEFKRSLPASARRFTQTWVKTPPSTNQGFFAELKEEIRNFAFGRYQATLRITGPTVGGAHQQQFIFYVIPWRLLLVVGSTLIAVVLFVSYRRAFRRAQQAKTQ